MMSPAGGGVEVSGGLVGQEHVGVHGQGAGDGHALHLAARQLGGPVLAPVRQPHPVQQLLHPLLALALSHLAEEHGHLDVLEGGDLRAAG
jgi:hypothetical protein